MNVFHVLQYLEDVKAFKKLNYSYKAPSTHYGRLHFLKRALTYGFSLFRYNFLLKISSHERILNALQFWGRHFLWRVFRTMRRLYRKLRFMRLSSLNGRLDRTRRHQTIRRYVGAEVEYVTKHLRKTMFISKNAISIQKFKLRVKNSVPFKKKLSLCANTEWV